MIYRSNLTAPDLTPHFKHTCSAPEPGSFDHDVIHDWADGGYPLPDKPSGFLTHDEAAILYNCALAVRGRWLDIGINTGWTMAHAAAAGLRVSGIEPWLRLDSWQERVMENLEPYWPSIDMLSFQKREQFREIHVQGYDGVMIDGDHSPGEPLLNAQMAADYGAQVIVLHDFIGGPVQDAVKWLLSQHYKARVYMTPYMLTVCWKGSFVPPDHTPDPNLPDLRARCPQFDFSRCS